MQFMSYERVNAFMISSARYLTASRCRQAGGMSSTMGGTDVDRLAADLAALPYA
jgi:hypothetical protein